MALTTWEREQRWRKRHPERYAARMRRYFRRSGSEEKDFGGHRRGRKPWDDAEEARVLAHDIPDRQLAEELDRTVKAISCRRALLKARAALPPQVREGAS